MQTAQRVCFWALPKPQGPGVPHVYRDESVLLTSLVAAARRLSYERIADWLACYDALAEALGYDVIDDAGRPRTISLSHYSRPLRELGLLPYFLISVALVTASPKMGLIRGWDLIIDSSLLVAWYQEDAAAAQSWPAKRKGHVFGYRVHTFLYRWSYLPLPFAVTPANRHHGPLAIPIFTTVVGLYHLAIHTVWADAANFNYGFLGFVRDVLHASVNVDYDLRRQGKRSLATLFFTRHWRGLMTPRSNIERRFAWMKRYLGPNYFRVQGYLALTHFVFRMYIAALIVVLIAARYGCISPLGQRVRQQGKTTPGEDESDEVGGVGMPSTREQRRIRLMQQAESLIDELLDWTDSTPQPNLTQIEDIVLELRRGFSEEMAREVIAAQETKQPVVGPLCPECGQEMGYKGQKRIRPQTWVGDVKIERGHYHCGECKVGLSPPG